MKIIRKILFPLVPIYFVITWLRNYLYDHGIKSSKSYDTPTLCVGNLNTGGSGKSPMVEYLIRILKANNNIAILSRGYRRKTNGFVLANDNTKPMDIGDEPYQIKSKFKDVIVAVDEKRQRGIENLLKKFSSLNVIILDDAYQHRKVSAKLNILLTPYQNMYYQDMVLPTGDLREPKSGSKRAHVIVATKCPRDISDVEKNAIKLKMKLRNNQSLFFSHIDYSQTVISLQGSTDLVALPKFTLVTGIANSTPLVTYLKRLGLQFEHLDFPDHHNFTQNEISQLSTKGMILTTEKDYVRLKDYKSLENQLHYLPIEFQIDRPEVFKSLILKALSD